MESIARKQCGAMNILPSSSVSPDRTVFSGGTPGQDPANLAPTLGIDRPEDLPKTQISQADLLPGPGPRPDPHGYHGVLPPLPAGGGARQPTLSEDAEDGVPGADAAGDRGPAGDGPAAGEPSPRPSRHDRGPAQGQSGMISSPGFLATVSPLAIRGIPAGRQSPSGTTPRSGQKTDGGKLKASGPTDALARSAGPRHRVRGRSRSRTSGGPRRWLRAGAGAPRGRPSRAGIR